MPSRNPLPFLVIGLVAVVGLAATGCGPDARSEPRRAEADLVDVLVTKATIGSIESALEISGSLAPESRVGVTAKLPGRLEQVNVQIGDHVAAGTTVATIERRDVAAQVDAAVAAVNVARAGLEAADAGRINAEQEVARARALFEKGALPRQRLDGAEAAHRAAVAQRDLAAATVAQAEAAGRHAGEVLRDTTLTSPISGVIVERNFDPGALVGRGEPPVVVVAAIRTLKLEAGVSELVAGQLAPGMVASVKVPARGEEELAGRLVAIAPQVDARNRHFRIELRLDNSRGELMPGMYAVARIVTAKATGAVVLPRDAVATRDNLRVVYKVEGGRIRHVRIVEGLADGQRVQVKSGLSAGDVVVADARRDLADQTPVRPISR